LFCLLGCHLGCIPGLPNQQRQAREQESASRIVNHIDLAGIETRVQILERNLHLEGGGVAVGGVDLLRG
jgi:hypothetical protein